MGRGQCFSIPKDEISLLEIRSKIERQGVLRGEKREFLSFFVVACMGDKRGSMRSSARKRLMLPIKDIWVIKTYYMTTTALFLLGFVQKSKGSDML